MQPQKQLSMSLMNGVRGGFKNITERTYVGFITGICFGMQMKPKESAGVIYKFRGEFYGENKKGKAFVAPVCYLPAPAQAALVEAMASGISQEFGIRCFVSPDQRSPTAYKWECEHLFPFVPSTALGDVVKRAKASMKSTKHKPK